MKIQTLIASIALLASGAVFAQTTPVNPTATPRIDARAANQQKRIDQGIASGSLTQTEAQRLEARQVRMKEAEARFKSDGVVTSKERTALTRMENKNSKSIYKAKHNGHRVHHKAHRKAYKAS